MFNRSFFPSVVIAVMLLCIPVSAAENSERVIDGVPLPADLSPVGATTGQMFSGVWAGRWDNAINTILAIEAVTDNGMARVVYAVAATARSKGAWFRYEARITGDTLTMFGKRHNVTFRISKTGRMQAVLGDGFAFGILTQQDDAAIGSPDAEISWTDGNSLFLETGLVENGRPVRLETILFRPEGDGPFPLVLINHGSTGSGNDPAMARRTWENAWLAEYLNERGWIVAFVQRRGRGQSDGLYDEGFAADRSHGYTCNAKLSLAGADRALEDLRAAVSALRRLPEVKPGPVLMAGNSRGGVLSIAYAGLYPEETSGVINFVGGWMGDGCETAEQINQTLFVKGARFPHPTLWLYGRDDVFYSIGHSRKNFQAFRSAGGTGVFFETTVRGENNGHWVLVVPTLWQAKLQQYLNELD